MGKKTDVGTQRLNYLKRELLKNIFKMKDLSKQEKLQKIKDIRINVVVPHFQRKSSIAHQSVNASLARALDLPHGQYNMIDDMLFSMINSAIRALKI